MPSPLPPASEAWRNGVTARVTAMNRMLDTATGDLTLDQMNHLERKGVLSIAFSLIHVVGGQDRNISRFVTNTPTLWERGDWKSKVGLVGEPPTRGTPMADAERIRFGNADSWREYQSAVFAQTESALTNAPLEIFDRDAYPEGRPDLSRSFLGLLVPSGTIRVREIVEAYIYQHGCRHLGEIEHARALVGLGGIS